MGFFKAGLVIIAAVFSACAGAMALPAKQPGGQASGGKAEDGTAYYYGQASFFSPDGKLPYGNTDSAVRREISGGGSCITETVTQPGSAHSMRPKEIVTVLKRRKKTLVYDASDSGGTFSGAVAFKDPGLTAWTYNIKLKAGGAITGSGSLSPEGIKTEKQLAGVRPMSVKEDLKTVSEKEYKMRVNDMRPPAGAE